MRDPRPSASRRGYGTDWRRLRASTPPAPCADCGARWHGGFHLDHRLARAKGGTDDRANLEWRCGACHGRKTAGADGGFGNPARSDAPPPIRKGVDVAGRPLDPNHPWNRPR